MLVTEAVPTLVRCEKAHPKYEPPDTVTEVLPLAGTFTGLEEDPRARSDEKRSVDEPEAAC